MNKIEELKKLRDSISKGLVKYSEDKSLSKPKQKYIKEWENGHKLIELLEVVIESEELKLKEQNIYYIVRNDNLDVLGRFLKVNEAIVCAEKNKRQYMRNYNDISVWVELEGETDKIYEAVGYENCEEQEIE